MSSRIDSYCGWGLFLSLLISIAHTFYSDVPVEIAAVITTLIAAVLFPRLIRIQKIQVLLLLLTGLSLIALSDGDILPLLLKAISVNHAIIALIISVSFLRLVTSQVSHTGELPTEPVAMWKTIAGAFVFSSVINLSALVIFGDRLQQGNKLHKTHMMIFSRIFGANAMWSPFFISMGAALLFSGGASLQVLLLAGFLMAILSLIITGLQCRYVCQQEGKAFRGYPMQFNNIILPLVLSLLVMILHWLFAEISILILVAVVVMLTVMVMLLFTQGTALLQATRDHIEQSLTRPASEILLFLSAGLLAVGIRAFIDSANFRLPIAEFTGLHAAISAWLMVFVSVLGLHPIVSIGVVGSLLAPLAPDPELLGMMFIFSWGLSIPLSPLSAIGLLMQSRYHAATFEVFRLNLGFTLLMLLPVSLVLILYGNHS